MKLYARTGHSMNQTWQLEREIDSKIYRQIE